MRPGEFNRHLAAEQDRSARLGRQWHAQRHVDIGMSGADECEADLNRRAALARRLIREVVSEQSAQLSAHWWHG